uniref:Uncharacterized protein n=1 Tax=Caenorhabditis japonica TaxID=281687 RepID=A0A8R1E830_CAEJA
MSQLSFNIMCYLNNTERYEKDNLSLSDTWEKDRLMQVTRNQSNIIKDDSKMWTEWHIAPQTWNCDFHKYLNDFHLIPIGTSLDARIEAMRRLSMVLKLAGIPRRHIEKVISETEKSNTKHATYGSKRSEQVMLQFNRSGLWLLNHDNKSCKENIRLFA